MSITKPDTTLMTDFKNSFCRAFCNRKKCKGCPIKDMELKQFRTVRVIDLVKVGKMAENVSSMRVNIHDENYS